MSDIKMGVTATVTQLYPNAVALYGLMLRSMFCPEPGRYATFLDRDKSPAISSAASSLRSSMSPSPASVKARPSCSAAMESPSDDTMAACFTCSAWVGGLGRGSGVQSEWLGEGRVGGVMLGVSRWVREEWVE